jgi:hypothetical protein
MHFSTPLFSSKKAFQSNLSWHGVTSQPWPSASLASWLLVVICRMHANSFVVVVQLIINESRGGAGRGGDRRGGDRRGGDRRVGRP